MFLLTSKSTSVSHLPSHEHKAALGSSPSHLCSPTFRNPILWVLWALAFLYSSPLFLLCYYSHSDSHILQFIPMQKSTLAFLCPGRGHWVSLLFLVNSYPNKWRWICFSRSIYWHRDLWADGFVVNVPRKREEMTREKEPKRSQNWTHTPTWSCRKLWRNKGCSREFVAPRKRKLYSQIPALGPDFCQGPPRKTELPDYSCSLNVPLEGQGQRATGIDQ